MYKYKPIKADTIGELMQKINEEAQDGWRCISTMIKNYDVLNDLYLAVLEHSVEEEEPVDKN